MVGCLLFERLTRTWPMHVTLGEEGSWVGSLVVLILRENIGLARDLLPLLLLLLGNIINGGGKSSVVPGLDMGFVCIFIFFNS